MSSAIGKAVAVPLWSYDLVLILLLADAAAATVVVAVLVKTAP